MTMSEVDIPLLELSIHHPAGETHTADTDTLHHTVTTQLMEYQGSIQDAGSLDLIGDDTAHKVGGGGVKLVHELAQLFLMLGGQGLATTLLLAATSLLASSHS